MCVVFVARLGCFDIICLFVLRCTERPQRRLGTSRSIQTCARRSDTVCVRACARALFLVAFVVSGCTHECMRATMHLHGCVRACVSGCVCAHTYVCARVGPCVSAPVAMDACTRGRMKCSHARASSLVRERACLADIAGQSRCMSLTDLFYAVDIMQHARLLPFVARACTRTHMRTPLSVSVRLWRGNSRGLLRRP